MNSRGNRGAADHDYFDSRCPYCRALLAGDARCPGCGRWLRLPANPFLEALSEEPDLGGGTAWQVERFPWREISPSVGLVIALVVMAVGVRASSLVIPAAGGIMAIACFLWAAVLEFQANRRIAQTEGDPAAMGMLPHSSDWPAVMRGSRRRQR